METLDKNELFSRMILEIDKNVHDKFSKIFAEKVRAVVRYYLSKREIKSMYPLHSHLWFKNLHMIGKNVLIITQKLSKKYVQYNAMTICLDPFKFIDENNCSVNLSLSTLVELLKLVCDHLREKSIILIDSTVNEYTVNKLLEYESIKEVVKEKKLIVYPKSAFYFGLAYCRSKEVYV
jgi:hypothetical protein